jgi:hypothetical protein
MNVWTGIVAGISALALTASLGSPASAATAGSCSWNGQVHVTPGLTFSPKDFTFTLDGTIEQCQMPNGEKRTGKITVSKGTGNGGCGSAQVETPFVVVWDGGRKQSTGEAAGVTSGPFGYVTGKLVDGDFGGTPFETAFFLTPQGPLQCGTSGVTSAAINGQITFR